MKLDGSLGSNVPVDSSAADDNRGHVNFCVHFRTFSDDQGVVTLNLAAKDPIDANAPFELELAVEFGASPEQGCDLGSRDLLFHAAGLPGTGARGQPADGFASDPKERACLRPRA
jgi:hypothetical protein